MFKNYFKIAYRNLLNHKFYSLINIMGLAVGIACCLLIVLFVQDELSYDRFNKKAGRIYRVATEINFSGNYFNVATTPAPLAEAFKNDFPEVESVVRFRNTGSWFVTRTDERSKETYKEEQVIYSDESFFDVFSIPLLKGNPATALKEPYSLVLSEKTAEKIFGEEDPVGKALLLDDEYNYKVTGVFEEIPANTHFHFSMMLSMESLEESKQDIWLSNNFNTYITLAEKADPAGLEAKFDDFIKKYVGPQIQNFLGTTMEESAKAGNNISFYLQPLTDIHLHSDLTAELEPNSDIKFVYIFTAIGFFILIIASINFMNLATARSARRAKEVGIRKTLGSGKRQLIIQFLTEAVILSILALIIAFGLVEIFLPAFNTLSGKELSIHYFENYTLIFSGIIITILVGLMSGSYPAFFLSSFKPIAVLKGNLLKAGAKDSWLRSGLVVFQFTISIILIVGTAVVFKQLNFIQNKKLGFNKEQVIILHDTFTLGSQLEAFKNEMLRKPGIINASASSFLPVRSSRSDMTFWPQGRPDNANVVSMQFWNVDEDYVPTFGMEIIVGRNFSEKFSTDSSAIILNEAALKKFGFKNPIGQVISTIKGAPGENSMQNIINYTVIGVVKDFHFESLRDNISPLCFMMPRSTGNLSFRINTGETSINETISALKEQWGKFAPGHPFDYSFLDDRFLEMYQAEQKIGKIFGVFAGIAIFIACLGLFGLAAFTAEQRTKEIGVRKVLGATVLDVVMLLTRQFSKLLFIAFILAAPISWLVMNDWLQNFAYRTQISISIFLVAGGVSFIVAWLTMSYQSVKAALINPVQSLKSE